mgnify:CR=1 FL=1
MLGFLTCCAWVAQFFAAFLPRAGAFGGVFGAWGSILTHSWAPEGPREPSGPHLESECEKDGKRRENGARNGRLLGSVFYILCDVGRLNWRPFFMYLLSLSGSSWRAH